MSQATQHSTRTEGLLLSMILRLRVAVCLPILHTNAWTFWLRVCDPTIRSVSKRQRALVTHHHHKSFTSSLLGINEQIGCWSESELLLLQRNRESIKYKLVGLIEPFVARNRQAELDLFALRNFSSRNPLEAALEGPFRNHWLRTL